MVLVVFRGIQLQDRSISPPMLSSNGDVTLAHWKSPLPCSCPTRQPLSIAPHQRRNTKPQPIKLCTSDIPTASVQWRKSKLSLLTWFTIYRRARSILEDLGLQFVSQRADIMKNLLSQSAYMHTETWEKSLCTRDSPNSTNSFWVSLWIIEPLIMSHREGYGETITCHTTPPSV